MDPLRVFYGVGWESPLQGGIGMPDVIFFEFEPVAVIQEVGHDCWSLRLDQDSFL